jgi:hypothetical protein
MTDSVTSAPPTQKSDNIPYPENSESLIIRIEREGRIYSIGPVKKDYLIL